MCVASSRVVPSRRRRRSRSRAASCRSRRWSPPGRPNKGLAERLDVSQRTVEKHLTSIYGKLGLRNRSELAAFVARVDPGRAPAGQDAQSS